MLILPGALPVAPPSDQAFAPVATPSPVKSVAALGASGKTRNETGANTNQNSGHNSKIEPPPDPDRPTGPPPTFEANLLEAEREKLRAGPELEKKGPQKETQPQPSVPYVPPQPEKHKVDMTV